MNVTRRDPCRRSIRSPRHLGVVCLLVVSLAFSACGEEDDAPTTEADGTSDAMPSPTGNGPDTPDALEHREIGTFQATGLRPVEDGATTTLSGAKGARAWLQGLGATRDTVDEVSEAVETAAVTEDETLHGVILSTGCLAPKSWTFTEIDDEWTVDVVPDEKEATTTCIAPVTTIGFVAVPSDG